MESKTEKKSSVKETRINTSLYITDQILKYADQKGYTLTQLLRNVVVAAMNKNDLGFRPSTKVWKSLIQRKETQRLLTETELLWLEDQCDITNLSKAKLITLMLHNECTKK